MPLAHHQLSASAEAADFAWSKLLLGDESILRSSALMDERVGGKWSPELRSPIQWEQVSFFFTNHLALTKDVRFTDDLLFILLEKPKN